MLQCSLLVTNHIKTPFFRRWLRTGSLTPYWPIWQAIFTPPFISVFNVTGNIQAFLFICVCSDRQYRHLSLSMYLVWWAIFTPPFIYFFTLDRQYSHLSWYMYLTLIPTSCKFYLIHMSWVLYMTLTPLLTLTHAAKWKAISSFSKNWVIGPFLLPFRLQTKYRIFKNRFRELISRRLRSKTSLISAATV